MSSIPLPRVLLIALAAFLGLLAAQVVVESQERSEAGDGSDSFLPTGSYPLRSVATRELHGRTTMAAELADGTVLIRDRFRGSPPRFCVAREAQSISAHAALHFRYHGPIVQQPKRGPLLLHPIAEIRLHVGSATGCERVLRDTTLGDPAPVTTSESFIAMHVSDRVVAAASDCEAIELTTLFDVDTNRCLVNVRNLSRP